MSHLYYGASGSLGPVFVTAVLIFSALVYILGWASLRSNSSTCIPAWRPFSFLAGLFLLWVAVASPLAELDHELLTVHMLGHLLLMTLAPPLIWLGEPVHCVARAFLPAVWRKQMSALHREETVRIRPEFCWLAAVAALVGWHIPAVFALAMHSAAWHFVEQSSFFLTGLLFWWPVVQPWPSVFRQDLSIILYLFFATLPCDLLSGFLVFCDRVVYPVYLSSSHLFGFSALGDQQCAAALMWTCVTFVYLVAGAIVAMRLLSTRDGELAQLDLQANAAPRSVRQSLEAF
jgi:cytochrome c oxidase assembly factor CtaG